MPDPDDINVTVNPDGPPIATTWNRDPALDFTVMLADTSGPPGPPGPIGPQGVRGSLFLGAYPTFANLPLIDGIDVAIGDYALVQDTSIMWQVR